MKKMITLFLLLVVLSGAYAATPAKPYTDAADGQVLTALWLNGMFSTLYTWAQTANTDITTLKSGVVGSTEVIGTIASATASATRPVVWTSTGLDYVVMTASGALAFDVDLVGTNPTGAEMARFKMSGVLLNNATECALLNGLITQAWSNNPALNATVTIPAVKQLRVIASTTTSLAWKAKMVTHEINY